MSIIDSPLKNNHPEVKVAAQNRRHARLLYVLYIGRHGELSNISNLLHHTLTFESSYPTLSAVLHDIAAEELEHFRLLGECIRLLGGNPIPHIPMGRGEGSVGIHNLDTQRSDDVIEVLRDTIASKQITLAQYKRIRESIEDLHVRELLDSIVKDEQKHIELLSSIYESIA